MCGIAGSFAYAANADPIDRDELLAIRDRMTARGPDGCGLWISDDQRVGFAHRRLSIIDLSESGAQPMWNRERTLCITFNGEIYNYRQLKQQMERSGCEFRSQSDTEVLLHLYAERGAEMVQQLRGMYAFAIWDVSNRTLFAARDPFGIKPLYYADDGRTFTFASQVKALLASSRIKRSPDPAGRAGFLIWGSVPDPFTFYRQIRALPAGHTLTLRQESSARIEVFCSIPEILRAAQSSQSASNAGDGAEHLHEALRDTVEHHLVADVPVGVFLSAGLDSSTIAALVSETHSQVRTVTLQFEEYRGKDVDEAPLAELVARQFRTTHQTISIGRHDFETESARLLRAMDQPSVDGVNTYFVSLAARRAGLKVALSGLGADELFGGYDSFREIPKTVRTLQAFPGVERIGKMLRVVAAPVIEKFTSPKYASLLEFGRSYPGAYLLRRALFMPWELPKVMGYDMAREGCEQLQTLQHLADDVDGLHSPRAKVSALELCCYMRQQLLRDSDWAGMAHSLEIRVPFVDVEFLRRLAPLLTSANPPGKQELARSPRLPLPAAVLARPKTGFSVPVREWMTAAQAHDQPERGLRGWARYLYSQADAAA